MTIYDEIVDFNDSISNSDIYSNKPAFVKDIAIIVVENQKWQTEMEKSKTRTVKT